MALVMAGRALAFRWQRRQYHAIGWVFQSIQAAATARRLRDDGLPKSSGSAPLVRGRHTWSSPTPLPTAIRSRQSANPREALLCANRAVALPGVTTRPSWRPTRLLGARRHLSCEPQVRASVADCCNTVDEPARAPRWVCVAHRQWPQDPAHRHRQSDGSFHAGLDLSGCGGLWIGL